MYHKSTNIHFLPAIFLILCIGWFGTIPAFGFSVDVSRIFYTDPGTPGSVPGSPWNVRQVNYDFTDGTITDNVLFIPDGFVTKPPEDAGLSYILYPFPDEDNDLTLQLNNGSCTMTTATHGGAIIYTHPTLSTTMPRPEWTYEVKLQNFTGISETGKEYRTQIGMGSMTPGPHPEFSAIWTSDGTLELEAEIYDNSRDSTIWSAGLVTLTGLTIGDTVVELRVALPPRASPGDPVIITFAYRINSGPWTALDSYTVTQEQLQQFLFLSFPGWFPYVELQEEAEWNEEPFQVYSFHQNNAGGNKYYGSAFLKDTNQAAYESVYISGSGCVTMAAAPMIYANGQWSMSSGLMLSENTSPSGCVQIFTVDAVRKSDGGMETLSKSITGYVEDFATNLQPTGTISTTPTFSWTGIDGAVSYSIRLEDTNYNQIWHSNNVSSLQTSIVYDGPALNNGQTYHYHVNAAMETNGSWNHSIAEGTFTYASSTISFSGMLRTAPNWPSTDVMLPVTGAHVVAFNVTNTQIGLATSDGMGAYTLTGLPKSTSFRLTIPTPTATNYAVVLSMFWNTANNIQALLPFTLFTAAQYEAFGNAPGTGMILGRIARMDNPSTFLAGATVLAEGWSGGAATGTTYPVIYTSGSTTAQDGIYMVKSVPSGTLVKLTAALSLHNFTYNGIFTPTYSGAVSEASFFATEIPAEDQIISGVVTGPSGPLSGAKVEALSGIGVETFAVTGSSGEYTLTVPGNRTYTIRVTVDGYVRKVVENVSVGTSGLSMPEIAYTHDDADDEPPTIADLQPEAGRTIGGAHPTISAFLSDARAGIDPATIEMRIDGGLVAPEYYSEMGYVSYTPAGEGLAAGLHQVTLDVRDFAGNAAVRTSWSFTVKLPIIVQYERTRITDSGAADDDQPSWRPDGGKIAFTSNRSGNYDIWTVNPDGTGLTRLTSSSMMEKSPSWSPDGTRIAYISFDPAKGIWGGYNLSTMNADGSAQTLHLMPQTNPASEDTFWSNEAVFTQWIDNQTIVFVSFGPDGGSYKIYRYNLLNSTVQDVTPANEVNPFGAIYNISWSAAKNLLAYDRWPIGIQTFTPVAGNTDYAVMDILRAYQMDTPSMPAWSPDGKKMAFVKDFYSETSNIAVYDLENQTTAINQTAQNDRWAAWSPGGAQIAIVSGQEFPQKNGSIWMLTLYTVPKGDINGDGYVDIADAVLALKILSGADATGIRPNYPASGADVNGDGKIGIQELEYILQRLGNLRP